MVTVETSPYSAVEQRLDVILHANSQNWLEHRCPARCGRMGLFRRVADWLTRQAGVQLRLQAGHRGRRGVDELAGGR